MDGFLVLLSCTMDDFPILLTSDEEIAVSAAQNYYTAVPEWLQDRFSTDSSELVCTKVVRFENGEPVSVRAVKEFV